MGKRKKRNKLTTEIFISESNEVHKGKYDYSQSVYKGWDNQIAIICPIHGLFYQKAGAHVKGKGSKKCADCERGHSKRLSTNEFINKSNEIHGNKYDYSKVVYETQYSKVRIICPIHGEFIQKAGNLKIGVRKQGNSFIAEVSKMDEKSYIGCFKTEDEAFQAYKREKEKYIKEVANDYFSKGLITERVRDLMYKYEVLEND